MSRNITNNQRETLSVVDTITSVPFKVKGITADGSINVNVTSGGAGGTQYAEGITTSPATGTVALGRYNTSPPTLTNGQLFAPQLDVNGNLKVNIASGGGSGGTSSSFGSAFPTTGTAIGISNGTNMVAIIQGQATMAASIPVVLASNQTSIPVAATLQAGSVVIGKVSIDQTTPGTTNKVDIADSLNQPISAFPATFLRTTDEPRQVFYDPFDSTLDVTNRWTSTQGSSGVAASTTTGIMSMGTGTAANGYSKLVSQPSFTLPIPAWLGASDAIAIPDLAAPTANSFRFWGVGTTPATPTTTTPITDAVGFEITTAGKMFAVVYAGGTRTAIQDLSAATGNSTQPTDANTHRYIVYIRTDKAYWYIDGITSAQLVATSNFQSPQVQTLPRLFLAVGGPTPPASNSQITCTGATAWDTGKNAIQLADGTFPWRKASISSAGSISVSLAANQSVNVAQINGVTPLMGNGTTGTGSQRVTIASDNTAFSVNATLSAETTKVIGTVNQGTNPWVTSNATTSVVGNGAAATAQRVTIANDSTGILATVGAVTAITNALPAGTNLLGKVGIDQTTVGTTNAVSLAQIGATTVVNGGVAGTLAVGGVTANGASKTGNPVRIGAVAHTANPTAVTDGQAVDLMADKLGKQVTVGSIRDLKANQVTTITASTAETTIVTSVASVFLDMYGLIISNTSATAVNVAIKDVTAGTTRFNFAVPAGDTRGFMLPEGGAIKQSAVTNNWTATVSASVTSVIITALTVQNL